MWCVVIQTASRRRRRRPQSDTFFFCLEPLAFMRRFHNIIIMRMICGSNSSVCVRTRALVSVCADIDVRVDVNVCE